MDILLEKANSVEIDFRRSFDGLEQTQLHNQSELVSEIRALERSVDDGINSERAVTRTGISNLGQQIEYASQVTRDSQLEVVTAVETSSFVGGRRHAKLRSDVHRLRSEARQHAHLLKQEIRQLKRELELSARAIASNVSIPSEIQIGASGGASRARLVLLAPRQAVLGRLLVCFFFQLIALEIGCETGVAKRPCRPSYHLFGWTFPP